MKDLEIQQKGESLGARARKKGHTPAVGDSPTKVGLAGVGRDRRSRVFWDNSNPFVFQILVQLHNLQVGSSTLKSI